MFLICHEDHTGAEYEEPRTFDTKTEALQYAEARADVQLPSGHAIVLYECRHVETLREAL